MHVKSVEEAYVILGVAHGAPEDEVKRAYKKLALKTHPDKNPDDPEAHKKFLMISEAYKRITDPDSFKEEEEEEMGDEEMQAMFNMMFAEMMGFGGAPFGMFGGMEDEYEDEIAEQIFHQMGMGMGMGMGGMYGGNVYVDGYSYGDEDDDEDEMDEEERELEAYLMAQLMGGGMGMGGMGMGGGMGRGHKATAGRPKIESKGKSTTKGGAGKSKKGDNKKKASHKDTKEVDKKETKQTVPNHRAAEKTPAVAKTKGGKGGDTHEDEDWETDEESEQEEWMRGIRGQPGMRGGPGGEEFAHLMAHFMGADMGKGMGRGGKSGMYMDREEELDDEGFEDDEDYLEEEEAMFEMFLQNMQKMGLRGDMSDMHDMMGMGMGMESTPGKNAKKNAKRKAKAKAKKAANASDPTASSQTPANPPTIPPVSGVGKSETGKKHVHATSASTEDHNPSSATSKAAASPSVVIVGDRVMVNKKYRGTVAFVGPVHYTGGVYVGVVVDDPAYGKNDGTVRGTRYFTVPGGEKRGLMVSLEEVKKI